MLPCGAPADDHANHSFRLEALEAEQMKLLVYIANSEQRIAVLEATLGRLQSLPGYQPQFSLAENLRMALGTLNDSIVMAHAVLAAGRLSDAHASAACYLASMGIPDDDSSLETADD